MNDKLAAVTEFFKKSKSPIVFVGAGVSMRAGLCSWSRLLEGMADALEVHCDLDAKIMRRELANNNLLDAAEYYFLAKSDNFLLSDKLSVISGLLSEFDASKIVGIFSLPVSQFVTTNFDRVLFSGYALAKKDGIAEVNVGDASLSSVSFRADPYVARINGRVEIPETMVLRRAGFDAIMKNTEYVDYLSYIFSRRQVLFLGFSFLDPAINAALSTVYARYGCSHDGRHIALLPESVDQALVSKLNDLKVGIIRYSHENSHEELWEIINGVKGQVGPNVPQIKSDPFKYTKKYLAYMLCAS